MMEKLTSIALVTTLFGAMTLSHGAVAAQAADTGAKQGVQSAAPQVLDQAKLDQMLAPIALYPDALLSQILMASTYPIEVVQAARWRDAHKGIADDKVIAAAKQQDWDPSVKALLPFNHLLQQMSRDLDWLQDLGDAFLANQAQVLDSVQNLRNKAYEQGKLTDNQYLNVERNQQHQITVTPVNPQVIYVPYYDPYIVYGRWWWNTYPPIYWRAPTGFISAGGFYWSPVVGISAGFYFGGFLWHERHVVVNYNYRHRHVYHRPTWHVKDRWRHNQFHRRSVRYDNHRVIRNVERNELIRRQQSHIRSREQLDRVSKQLNDRRHLGERVSKPHIPAPAKPGSVRNREDLMRKPNHPYRALPIQQRQNQNQRTLTTPPRYTPTVKPARPVPARENQVKQSRNHNNKPPAMQRRDSQRQFNNGNHRRDKER